MSRLSWTSVLLFLAAAFARLIFSLATGYTADDAFITFRYAENLAYGLGFVYNEGERVLGTSSPLFTFILALTTLFRIPLIWAALLLSMVAAGLTSVVLYRFARFFRFTALAVLPALAYAFWPRSLSADASGMETAVFTLFVVAAFYYQRKHFEIYALGMATLATLTRPEGALLLILLVAYNLYRTPRFWPVFLATPAIVLLPWIIFATLYFGSPVPHSITAKLALYSQFGAESPLYNLAYLLGLHHAAGWILLVAAILGAAWIYRKLNTGRLEVIWLLATLLFFAFSRTHMFHWYIAPIYPIYLLIASAAVLLILDRFALSAVQFRHAATAVTVIVVVVVAIGAYPQLRDYREYQTVLNNVHQQIGYYLFAETPLDATIAAEDIGYSGYYSRRHILDRDGLVSPQSVPYNRQGRYLELIRDARPGYVVAALDSPISPFLDDSEFKENYTLQKQFRHQSVEYHIYSRRTEQAGEGN